ncbi:unnamed protein product [Meloidogyne enterolobii]|uniref:Uncharacterized protein n=3 Tax=Meloidogyne enterolobii TaxID=390850 RepID=A0A6V7XDE8_MELEN|nr:unnamed protein product [Meloidogyne enterolobii]
MPRHLIISAPKHPPSLTQFSLPSLSFIPSNNSIHFFMFANFSCILQFLFYVSDRCVLAVKCLFLFLKHLKYCFFCSRHTD